MNSRMLWLTTLALAAAELAFPQTYFPVGALPDVASVQYARFLTAMHEPSLYELSKQNPTRKLIACYGCVAIEGQLAFASRRNPEARDGLTVA